LVNDIEAFTIALANMDAAVAQRVQRFHSAFITGIKPSDVLTPEQIKAAPHNHQDYSPDTFQQELAGLANPVAPIENTGDEGIGDLQSESRLKVTRAAQAVDLTLDLLGTDLLTATFWMDVRRAQDPSRHFGLAPDSALAAFRNLVPFQLDEEARQQKPLGEVATGFLRDTSALSFYPSEQAPPSPETFPPAGEFKARK
jgi:histidine ammonia-lyase